MIAALFVETNGVYFGLPNVDPYDIKRDAMTYRGPWPVVAHPPCARWCRLAGYVEACHGHKRGDDGGTFAHALKCVRTFGGVLEHPAYSAAWAAFGLPVPSVFGWWQRGTCGGWSCHVEQGRYGHVAKKATWLYAFGASLPSLRWGHVADHKSTSPVAWRMRNQFASDTRPMLSKAEASKTPLDFRDVLIAMAESVAETRLEA